MVGGFSGCEILQKAVKDNFPDKKVIIPEDAGLAVVKGAVYFGHVPQAISRRSAAYTYGIQICPEFNEEIHPQSKKIIIGGKARCKDVFFICVKKGERITPGFSKSQIFQVMYDQGEYECEMFISNNPDPKFTDDKGCKRVRVLKVPLTHKGAGPSDRNSRMIKVTFIVEENELRVRAREVPTPQATTIDLNSLLE
jgi:molecular chaperone DnaK (HSP70)